MSKYITIEQLVISILLVSNLYWMLNAIRLRKEVKISNVEDAYKHVEETGKQLREMHNEVESIKEDFSNYLSELEKRIRTTISMYYDSMHKYNEVILSIYGVAHDAEESKTLNKIENCREEVEAIYNELDDLKVLWPEFYEGEDDEETGV